jgi:putative PEP-CTERM system histidine kinase
MILVNLEETLRASTGSKRWQIKFMVLGLGSLFAVQIYTISQTLLFSSVNLSIDRVHSYTVIMAGILIALSLSRNRFLDVEIYLSRAFLYNSITIVIIGIYLLVVGVLAKAIGYFGDVKVVSLGTLFVFVSLLGLTIVLLSDQIQHEIKRFISRNFYQNHYDYRKEWMAFTKRTTSLVDIKDLCAAVSKMVSETFGVSSVTVWLLNEKLDQVVVGGSTVFSGIQPPSLRTAEKASETFIDIMRDRSIPLDFNASTDVRVKGLKESYPEYFRDGRIRYCAPLIAGQQLLGWITLNERLTNEPFSVEDFDLLKTISDQVAGSLLNLKLSDHLLKAKEMEAFQTLSAFFIHDLKNLASTLSLTMQNFPIHFDNPEFRSDALRVFSLSVTKMNAMCSRLSTLTKKMELRKTKKDLNQLIDETLGRMNGSVTATLARDLHPLPSLLIDPEQMEKVILNLILNANQAVGPNGEIRVETGRMEGWAVLSVKDNGCGISKEFMSRSLFQPFQTTKSEGLGIGLFHSKKIVEAHQGRIDVESEEGVGTTFRVALPLG